MSVNTTPYSSSWAQRVVPVVHSALAQGLLDPEEAPIAQFFDLNVFRANAKACLASISHPNVTHTYAVKANPVKGVMLEALKAGLGAECASFTEVLHSLNCGFPAEKVIFDSPCKTGSELKKSFELGIYVNLDNFQEVDRVAELLKKHPELESKARVGIRINPQVGGGSIAVTSTATATSKFGTALLDHREKLIEAFRNNSWLKGLHCHVGSQGCPVGLIADGAKRTVDFAREVNKVLGRQQIETLDIGGGLPVNYCGDETYPSFEDYSKVMKEVVPEVFTSEFKILTEMGRSLVTKPGITVSYVETTKVSGGRPIATTHAGADLFVRPSYLPEKWPLRISVLDGKANFAPKEGKDVNQDIAGPLCFSGDLMATNRAMPLVEMGDMIVVHDSGSYTYSMFSRYNSRCAPAFIAYEDVNGKFVFTTFKKRETPEQVLAFWE